MTFPSVCNQRNEARDSQVTTLKRRSIARASSPTMLIRCAGVWMKILRGSRASAVSNRGSSKVSRANVDNKGNKDSADSKANKDNRDSKDSKDSRDNKVSRDSKDNRDSREILRTDRTQETVVRAGMVPAADMVPGTIGK